MRKSISILFAFLLLMCTIAAFGQSNTVSGLVTDVNGEPLIGVNILVKGTTTGVTTNIDGKYSLQPITNQSTLIFSYVGFVTQEILLGNQRTLDVKLVEDFSSLDEVVVIGYGQQTRREVTGSVTQVTEADFNQGIVRDAADLLQGRVAGLVITTGSGDVTRGAQIRLRGTSTLQNDQGPFIVIDGVPGGSLTDVAAQDIESISVLKDASSAAIYGSRAAGGVILITTKRGQGMRTSINYTGITSVDFMRGKPKMMTSQQIRDLAKERGWDVSIYDKYNADTDWFDEITRNGVSQNHSLSLSGSGAKNNYRASFNYLDRSGILRDNDMQRMNFRLQFQQRALKDKLRIGITTSVTANDARMPYNDNILRAYNMLPFYPVYNPDGSYFTLVDSEFDQGNPVAVQDLNENRRKDLSYFGIGDIQFTIMEGLNIKANLYTSRNSSETRTYRDANTYPGRGTEGFAQRQNRLTDRQSMEYLVDFEREFGNHKISALAGYSWESRETAYFSAQNRSFLVDLKWNDLGAGANPQAGDVSSSGNAQKLISGFGRIQYGFKERYMITATLRRDGSSKFGADNKWGVFPSTALAWNLSQESFLKGVNWVNDMKLRVGWGRTGNQDGLQPYRSLATYTAQGNYYDNGSWPTAFAPNRNPNPDLKWETTQTINVGLDFSLFNRKINGTIEWYQKKTFDMLYTYNVPQPPYIASTMQANVGDLTNTGIEFSITANILRQRNYSWILAFNASHNRNKVVKMSNQLFSTGRLYLGDPWIRGGSGVISHVIEEGYPLGQFFLLICDGIDADGKYIHRDINGDGIINESDRDYAGTNNPWLNFGLNNQLSYKQLDLSFFFRGTLGQKVLNNPRAAYAQTTFLPGANALDDPLTYQLRQSAVINSYYLEDASFVRLDNIALGYTVKLKNRDYIERLRFYISGQDLLVLTHYKGRDPEVEIFRGSAEDSGAGLSSGIEQRQYIPRARTFSLGLNLTF